jgi:hypothetical protein
MALDREVASGTLDPVGRGRQLPRRTGANVALLDPPVGQPPAAIVITMCVRANFPSHFGAYLSVRLYYTT